jgi:hypothetical protein
MFTAEKIEIQGREYNVDPTNGLPTGRRRGGRVMLTKEQARELAREIHGEMAGYLMGRLDGLSDEEQTLVTDELNISIREDGIEQ